MKLDLLLTGLQARTMDSTHPSAHAIGIWNGQIAGLDDDVKGLEARSTIDLAGKVVLPGFHDAHCHTTSVGVETTQLALGSARSTAEILDKVRRHADGLPADEWVIGTGYLDREEPHRHPTASQLDVAGGGRPVWLTHRSGHLCAVSHAVLGMLPAPVPPAQAGFVVRDPSGSPTGVLEETAMDMVKEVVGPASVGHLVDAIDTATAQYAAEGITSFTDAGIGCPGIDHSPLEIAAYQQARAHGKLHARAQLMVYSEIMHDLAGSGQETDWLGMDLGVRTGFGDPWLRLGAMKIWIDGAGSAGTAAISGQDSSTCYVDNPERMRELIIRAHRSGWQVAAHAMGDLATDLLLDALQAAGPIAEVAGRRHRIEHAGLLRSDQVQRIATLGVACVIQPQFITEFGDIFAEHFGPDRVGWSLRAASLLRAGVVVAAGSDRPVAPGAPLASIAAMVRRRTASGRAYGPDESVPVEAAIRAHTAAGALAAHSESCVGLLRPGLLADLVVLDADPVTSPANEIADIAVVATLVGGYATYDPAGLFGR